MSTLHPVFKIVKKLPDGRLVSPCVGDPEWRVVYVRDTFVTPQKPNSHLYAFGRFTLASVYLLGPLQAPDLELWAGVSDAVGIPSKEAWPCDPRFFETFWYGDRRRVVTVEPWPGTLVCKRIKLQFKIPLERK